MKLQFIEVGAADVNAIMEALALYDRSFPEEVREPHDVLLRGIELRQALAPNAFHFVIARDQQGQTLGLATAHYLATVNFGFVVYLVVDERVQGRGIGGALLAHVESLLQQDAAAQNCSLCGVILETERAEDALTPEEQANSRARSRFFRRQGYRVLHDVSYLQPPLHTTTPAVLLHLYVKRFAAGSVVSGSELAAIVQAMYADKYGQINGVSAALLQSCLQRLCIPEGEWQMSDL